MAPPAASTQSKDVVPEFQPNFLAFIMGTYVCHTPHAQPWDCAPQNRSFYHPYSLLILFCTAEGFHREKKVKFGAAMCFFKDPRHINCMRISSIFAQLHCILILYLVFQASSSGRKEPCAWPIGRRSSSDIRLHAK